MVEDGDDASVGACPDLLSTLVATLESVVPAAEAVTARAIVTAYTIKGIVSMTTVAGHHSLRGAACS